MALTGGTAPSADSVGSASSAIHERGARIGLLLTADTEGGSVLNDTEQLELTTDVSGTEDDLGDVIVQGGREGHAPVRGQVRDDERGGLSGVGSEGGSGGRSSGAESDSSGSGGRLLSSSVRIEASVGHSQGVSQGTRRRGGIVDDIEMLSNRETVGSGVLSSGDVDEQGVLDSPGVGADELSREGRVRWGSVSVQVVGSERVRVSIEHLSVHSGGGIDEENSGRLRAVSSGVSDVASARSAVVVVDNASTSGSAVAADVSGLAGRGRAVGVTGGANIDDAVGVLNVVVREATVAVGDGDVVEDIRAGLGRGSDDGGSRGEGGDRLGLGVVEDPGVDGALLTLADCSVGCGVGALRGVDVGDPVGVVSVVIDRHGDEGSGEERDRGSVGSDGDRETGLENDGASCAQCLPSGISSVTSSGDLLETEGTEHTHIASPRGGELEEGVSVTERDCASEGGSSGAVGLVVRRELQLHLTGVVLATNQIEVARNVLSIEVRAGTSVPVVDLVVRISPTIAVEPSSGSSVGEDGTGNVERGGVGTSGGSSDATAGRASGRLGEVETDDEASGAPGELSVGEGSVSLHSCERERLIPDLDGVDETTEASSGGRVSHEGVVASEAVEHEGGGLELSAEHSVDVDLSEACSVAVEHVHGDVGPGLVNVDTSG